MGSCDKLEPKLGALLDGELDPQEEQDLRNHMAGCHLCRSRLQAIQGLERDAVAALRSPEPTDADWARIETGIREAVAGARRPVAPPRIRRAPAIEYFVPALALAACVIIVAVMGFVSLSRREPPRAPDVYSSKEYEIRVEPLAPEDEDGALWIEVTRG
ncbi:MAG: zf-HC2 domain-containing protein [Planctomycetes bacterium]|nr:zf-HC2 domain-containing protein [Planctomycetota bacterium]